MAILWLEVEGRVLRIHYCVNFMEIHGAPWISITVPWSFMEPHGIPWDFMEFHHGNVPGSMAEIVCEIP